jgi:Cu(I)/Ag(I) efflux system protein CusF
MVKHIGFRGFALAIFFAIISVAPAQSDEFVNGQVTKVDRSASKVTIKHGALRKFGMDEGMTMVFHAADPAMLQTVKPGDRIRFMPDRINGQFTVTKIEKAE